MSISENLRQAMEGKNINQKRLAQLAGVTESSVCRYLQGNRRFNMATCAKLAEALGVSIDFLLNSTKKQTTFAQIEADIISLKQKLSVEEKHRLAILLLS